MKTLMLHTRQTRWKLLGIFDTLPMPGTHKENCTCPSGHGPYTFPFPFILKRKKKFPTFVFTWIQFWLMYLIEKTTEFDKWLRKLKDFRAKAKVLVRIQRIELKGNFGDCKSVGDGLMELRIEEGKGYRVYYKEQGKTVVLLLLGGDKSTQSADIAKAKSLWTKYKNKKS
ncbi:MAG: type II toxin-antitoxin system RelE/ParE family toxin [Bacteroidia bacterium]